MPALLIIRRYTDVGILRKQNRLYLDGACQWMIFLSDSELVHAEHTADNEAHRLQHTLIVECLSQRFYMLDSQNPNGTWESYEAFRNADEPYLDQRLYLHTTIVAIYALSEAYADDWPLSE